MADEAKTKKLTLWEAINDLGWFPLLLIGLGGFSILAILEQVVFRQPLELVQIFQWPLDGYHRVMRLLGAVVEPLIQPAIDWAAAQMDLRLTLDPVWRPLFALGMVVVLGYSRTRWRNGNRVGATAFALGVGFGVLVGTVLAGVTPSEGGWSLKAFFQVAPALSVFSPVELLPGNTDWSVQVLRAAAPLASFLFLFALFEAGDSPSLRGLRAMAHVLQQGAVTAAGAVFLVSALVTGLLVFVPVLESVAGVVTLAGIVALLGVSLVAFGLRDRDTARTRTGLTIFGGFVTAGLILAADWGLRALDAG